ncbi:SoxR reducing system RseC family protein [Suttonella ornithocola]|uniref:Positive regulator of sigma E activity n=1 Tax=Suttonella ornithocola TaxID=279832 RepID=A0A380MR71_9GAMM|nr:SoxR reducing system RseC family protein [Suttonella ornithocola]SUO93807.1 Positive regulator of sigma E activity [Suttonella ornithocola]
MLNTKVFMTNALLSLPVKIIHQTADTLTVLPVDVIEDCPKCAAGEGCGQNPWFRGFFRKRELTLPRPTNFPENQSFAELQLPNHILNYLTLMVYALPLLSFIITLLLLTNFPAWIPFLGAILLSGLTLSLTHPLQQRLLRRYLTLSLPLDKQTFKA